MKEEPVTRVCAQILRAREHAVIGVSPFNSYFSEERIAGLVAWAKERFSAFHIYVPDGPARFTLEALGHPAEKARKKATRQARWLFNRIRRGLEAAGFGADAFDDVVLHSKALDGHGAYRRLLDDVESICQGDAEFRRGCAETSRWVLNGQAGDVGQITSEMEEKAVRYFMAELPLFMNTPELVGVNSSTFIYHQCPSFIERLFLERRGDVVSTRQGFVKVAAE